VAAVCKQIAVIKNTYHRWWIEAVSVGRILDDVSPLR